MSDAIFNNTGVGCVHVAGQCDLLGCQQWELKSTAERMEESAGIIVDMQSVLNQLL